MATTFQAPSAVKGSQGRLGAALPARVDDAPSGPKVLRRRFAQSVYR